MLRWYAVLKRDSRRTAYLAGPFASRVTAENFVEPAHEAALDLDPFCHFDTPGVMSVETEKPLPAGRLNRFLGIG